MKNLCDLTMWAAQTPMVWNIVEQDGVSWVKEEYIDKKYGEVAWIFKTAYRYFIRNMEQEIVRPQEAEFPVWLYRDPKWAGVNQGVEIRRLQIPKEEVLLFDLRKWSQVLNLEFLGTKEEKERFERELESQGIRDPLDVFATPYYPLLKRQVIKSWDHLFDIEETEESYLQGAVWCLKKEWLWER